MAFRRGCQLRSNNVNMNVIEEEYHQSYNSLSIVTELHKHIHIIEIEDTLTMEKEASAIITDLIECQ